MKWLYDNDDVDNCGNGGSDDIIGSNDMSDYEYSFFYNEDGAYAVTCVEEGD